MSTATLPKGSAFFDRASDWLNPILVKETRQALKSRQFIATFFLVLVASWLVSVFGTVMGGSNLEFQDYGQQFCSAYYVVLAIAIFVVVPFGAFRSMLSERDLHTWEVLSITTLKPRQIVWGKLTSAVVQLFIYYSAITPFMAFANLLKGIDVPTIAFVLVASMVWSLAMSLLALTMSTFGSQRYWQVFLTLAMLGGLLMAMFTSISVVFSGMEIRFAFDEPGFWWGVAGVLSFLAAYCALFLQIAVAQLTFDADNRSSGIRLAASGVFWLAVAWFGGILLVQGHWGVPSVSTREVDDMLMPFAVVCGLHWFITGLFAVTETDALSRRVRRDAQRFGSFRVLVAPWLPGGGRGLVYFIGHITVLLVFVVLVSFVFGTGDERLLYFATGGWCYLVIYLGFGAAMGRAARAYFGDSRPSHTRVLTVLMMAIASILPLTLYIFDSIRTAPTLSPLLFVTDPFSTLFRLAENNPSSGLLLIVLGIAALVSILLNLRAMLAGIVDVTRTATSPAAPAPAILPTASAN